MKVKYIGKKSDPLYFINGKVYEKIRETELCGKEMWGVIDETGEDYLYPPSIFEVVSDDEAKQIEESHVPHKCPICGEHEFSMENSYECCPVCRWCDTDDPVWNHDLTEDEYREAYKSKTGD